MVVRGESWRKVATCVLVLLRASLCCCVFARAVLGCVLVCGVLRWLCSSRFVWPAVFHSRGDLDFALTLLSFASTAHSQQPASSRTPQGRSSLATQTMDATMLHLHNLPMQNFVVASDEQKKAYALWLLRQPTTRYGFIRRRERSKLAHVLVRNDELQHVIEAAYLQLVEDHEQLADQVHIYALKIPGYMAKVQELRAQKQALTEDLLEELAIAVLLEGGNPEGN